MTDKQKQEVLELLNKANDILLLAIIDDDSENQENIFCPLGEVIENVGDWENGVIKMKKITFAEALYIEKKLDKTIFCSASDGSLFYVVSCTEVPVMSCIGGYQCILDKDDRFEWNVR